ncbi:Heat shock protein DnaJ, cysteine-rich domain containing protein [Melia azedarach]|uniref:Heat shock protein DnaJ, cysteine-rich domain containing protein n=1 Tax=Melia azedarach TaxID=155640 RepID=A0ACC1X7S0_MELAZ|nr:Heat shock protein DnaJ, cysteine-rich domain containing protein [Melia azedarach]
MEGLTASEIAGFGVGTLLLCATIAAPKLDAFFSASQRSSLGMCKRCGDLRMVPCMKCKGTGSVKSNGPIDLSVMDNLYLVFGGAESKVKSIRCSKCQAKGHFRCPDCANISRV